MQSLYNQSKADYYFANGDNGLDIAAGQLWTPAAISTSLWLDANDSSTITLNSGNVSAWNDKSGNNRHATQSTTSRQPLYVSNGLNNKGLIRPDGDGEYLGLDSALSVGAVFMVYAAASGYTTGDRFLLGDRIGLTRYYHFHAGTSGSLLFDSTFAAAVINAPAAARVNGTAITPTSITKTTAHTILALTALSSGGPWYFSALGTDNYSADGRAWRGDYVEVIVLSSSATTTQTEIIEGYLAWKWNLVSSLPDNHPYKNAAPTY